MGSRVCECGIQEEVNSGSHLTSYSLSVFSVPGSVLVWHASMNKKVEFPRDKVDIHGNIYQIASRVYCSSAI